LSDLVKDLSPNYNFVDYIKRFFYQIIGIYFPAAILFLYLFLFWYTGSFETDANQDPVNILAKSYNITWSTHIENNLKDLQQDIGKDNPVIQLFLFLITIVVLGECINAITSYLAKLSPISGSLWDRIKLRDLKNDFPEIYRSAKWPIWLNETTFPASFAQFDRYYVSALEQDKRTLAGKIGWVSFYRNMVAVFAIIFVLQISIIVILFLGSNPQLYGYEYYVLATAGIAIVLLLIGYKSQVTSNKDTFWDAYKRYQTRKHLEIRYGDLTLAFGINEKYRGRALEYIVDRWFLGVDNTMQTISRWFLTKLEGEYRELKNRIVPDKNKKEKKAMEKLEDKVRKKLIESYSNWNKGTYERVIANSLSSFKDIEKSFNKMKTSNNKYPIMTDQQWKTLLGFYILENSLRTDAAFLEISKNLSAWGWTGYAINKKGKNEHHRESENTREHIHYTGLEEKNIKSKYFSEGEIHDYYTTEPLKHRKDLLDQTANIIRETSDDYQKAFFAIMRTLKTFNKLLSQNRLQDPQKEQCYENLREIYCLFGGYQYAKAFEKAKEFFNEIYDTGTVNVLLKSDGNSRSFSGYILERTLT
jgi:hypothetical protein